ncbi:MAG: histidine--tRNA ligase, partial [Bacteroidales bacterium]|nr:histidine--tRNA ligase [Bacteroidales bacterium]
PAGLGEGSRLLFANMGETAYILPVAGALRAAGVSVEVYPEESKLKKQFDYADRKGIPFISICGETEAAEGMIQIKKLSTGEQVSYSKEDIAGILAFLS